MYICSCWHLNSVIWSPGPDPVLKPNLGYMCQPQPFQAMTPTQNLRPPPVIIPPDPLRFPLCTPLAVKPPPHLQMPPSPSIPAPPVSSPKPPEEDCQTLGADQEATLEELCKPLYCKLCNVTLNSAQQAQAHYQVIWTLVLWSTKYENKIVCLCEHSG